MKKKTLTMLIALVLVLACAVGGTLAYLMDTTTEVKNTFTIGDVEIELTETVAPDGSALEGTWEAQLIPGTTYQKNPVVAVLDETNVDCYLFVKFDENNNPKDYLTYTSTLTTDPEWKLVDGETNVWYREVYVDDESKSWNLLEGNVVVVNEDLTKEEMENITIPELVYTAYAIQMNNFDSVADAWAEFE